MDKEQAEEWKSVVGFEGLYEVSSYGNIRNCKTGKIQAKHLVGKGYVKADFYRGNVKTQTSVHRVVATAFHGEPKPKQQVNHKNGIKTDNRAENLEWVSKSENEIHSRYSLGNLCKRVLARNLSTGEELIFPSIAQAGDRLKILASAISKCITGTMKTTHGWCFVHLENGHETFSDQVAAAVLKATKPLEEKLSWLDYTEKMNKALVVEIEELRAQLVAAQEENGTLRKDAETYGPEKIAIQKQAWLEADRQRQINDLKDRLAKAEQLWQVAQGRCDGLEEKLANAEQRVAEWQPIETAPKGEAFLAVLSCGDHQTVCTMRWPVAEAKNSRVGNGEFILERVTHWMPLPKAPANGASS